MMKVKCVYDRKPAVRKSVLCCIWDGFHKVQRYELGCLRSQNTYFVTSNGGLPLNRCGSRVICWCDLPKMPNMEQ